MGTYTSLGINRTYYYVRTPTLLAEVVMVFTKVEGTASSPTPNVIEVTPKAIKEKGRLYVLETEGVEQVNEDLALGRVYWPATGFYNMTLLTRAQPSDEWEIVYKELIRVK